MLKFYESHFEEYCLATEKCNLHPELEPVFANFPKKISQLNNMIIYGPSGTGKYSQTLKLLKQYSPTELKYEKKITVQTDKHNYIYHISDIHYEVDMSFLGCNSKLLWQEVFMQIIDIVSVKHDKIGIILCKNFHTIHTELLDIFYSYIQQYNHQQTSIQIKFIILTDNISFIPNKILNSCYTLSIARPSKEQYSNILKYNYCPQQHQSNPINSSKIDKIMDTLQKDQIMNIKEIRSLTILDELGNIPTDIFNVICDNIIQEIVNHDKIVITAFRDIIYDILIYNLDIGDVLWYILSHFIKKSNISPEFAIETRVITDITNQIFVFLKQYNNNYRPIYHLESIFFYFITKIYKYELPYGY
jgi:adenylate kinase family enzyme